MHRPLLISCFVLFLLVFPTGGRICAQVIVDTSYKAEALVREVLLGGGVEVSNISYTGSARALAYFINPSGNPNIKRGVLLSSGFAPGAKGPNNSNNYGVGNNTPGDMQLQRIARGHTYDACILEFDFVTELDKVAFNFFFASDEYPEYVNSQFNDVFAFFISGPGIQGIKNLAIIPQTGQPITINTVNSGKNPGSYIDNSVWGRRGFTVQSKVEQAEKELLNNIQFDGLTTLLTAKARVAPGQTYHIKIAICDVGDAYLDSGVFLQAGSFASLVSTPDPDIPEPLAKRGKLQWNPEAEIATPDSGGPYSEEEPTTAPGPKEPEGKTRPPATMEIGVKDKNREELATANISFDFDTDSLSEGSKALLRMLYLQLQAQTSARVEILGHTDGQGSNGYNQRLSERRARAVREYLTGQGLDPGRIRMEGFGPRRPLSGNETDEGRALNRRVEIILLK